MRNILNTLIQKYPTRSEYSLTCSRRKEKTMRRSCHHLTTITSICSSPGLSISKNTCCNTNNTLPFHQPTMSRHDPGSLLNLLSHITMPPHCPTCPHGEHRQQSQHSPQQVNQLVMRNQMNQCAIQPQLVTIYKEVHILLTLIFLPLVFYVLVLTPDARQRVILIEI